MALEQYITFGSIVLFGVLAAGLVFVLGFMIPKMVKPLAFYKNFTSIYEKFPIARVFDDGSFVTKQGLHGRIVEVEGRNFQSIEPSKGESILRRRMQWLDNIPTGVTFMIQSHRNIYNGMENEDYGPLSKYVRLAMEAWTRNFKTNYRSRHYILFLAEGGGVMDKIESKTKGKSQRRADNIKLLDEAVRQTKDRLGAEYKVKDLTKALAFSYFATLLQGRSTYIRPTASGVTDNLITGTDIYWPERKRYQEYLGPTKRYSAWISFNTPNAWTVHQTITDLFGKEIEFSLYQTGRRLDKQPAILTVKDFRMKLGSSSLAAESRDREFEELIERLDSGEVSLFQYRFSLEVKADSLEVLERDITELQRIIETDGYLVKREDLNQEALFWSSFPGTHSLNPRVHYPTTENIALVSTFPARVKGLNRCSFGPAPWTQFKTDEGDAYTFVPHVDESPEALGNMLIIGGAGKGKTTLISFLIMCCFKYLYFRAICFDRHNGMEVFTRMADGIYFLGDDIDTMGMNPLQMADSMSNRAFLSDFMALLAGVGEDHAQRRDIDETVRMNFEIPKEDRHLAQFVNGVGHSGLELRDAFDPWLPGGRYEAYFSSEEDSLSFEHHQIVSFDMTEMLDREMVLGPFLYYLFHKISTESAGNPFVMFVDEAPAFFQQPMFQPKAKQILDEFRKRNGVGIFAGQNASDFTSQWFAESFKKQIATTIFFPDHKANKEEYMTHFGLNEREFDWIKTFTPKKGERRVLVKRQEAEESVILNVDISILGENMAMFNSSQRAATLIRDLFAKNPEGFKEEYLAQENGHLFSPVPSVNERSERARH